MSDILELPFKMFRNRYNKEVNQRSNQSSNHETPAPTPEPKASRKPEAPKSSYYKALPTASGLELDKAKVKLLVEMGFQVEISKFKLVKNLSKQIVSKQCRRPIMTWNLHLMDFKI